MSRSCFSWAAASHQHFQGAKSLTRSPHPWLSCSPRHLPALGSDVGHSHSQLIPPNHPKPLSQTHSQQSQCFFQQSQCFFLVRGVWMCVEELFTHPAHPLQGAPLGAQSSICNTPINKKKKEKALVNHFTT